MRGARAFPNRATSWPTFAPAGRGHGPAGRNVGTEVEPLFADWTVAAHALTQGELGRALLMPALLLPAAYTGERLTLHLYMDYIP